MSVQAPRIFISYSHDSDAHKGRVLQLADRLRGDGVDTVLDRYETAPPDGWPLWMQEQTERADFVVMVCTETYDRRVRKREAPGKGLGGAWEGQLIYNLVYAAGASVGRVVPVLFSEDDERFVPLPFRSAARFVVSDDGGYQALLGRLTGQPDAARPPLGPQPPRRQQWESRPEIRLLGVPPSPALFVGRSEAVRRFKQVLGVLPGDDGEPASSPTRIAAIHGLPGVGKSTFVAALPHDLDIRATYPDGILWTAFGQSEHLAPQLAGTLADWAYDWEGPAATAAPTLNRAIDTWTTRLRRRRVLVVVDDVWRPDLVQRLIGIVDDGSTFLLTSRMPTTVEQIVPRAPHRYRLDVLDTAAAVELLAALAPSVVAEHADAAADLVDKLGRLPLALTVAGRLLGSAAAGVRGIERLIDDLRAGVRLLDQAPPAETVALMHETSPSVAALLHRSTNMLDAELRGHFARLGVFEPDPATFDLAAMAAVCGIADPEPVAEALVGIGLLESLGDGRLRMHALVALLARSMLEAL